MGRGTGFGKTILIGDQFVLYGVPAVVSALPYETVADVERVDGEGWSLGAKLTGGGMGGYMIALTPDQNTQEVVASAIEKQGCGVIRATIASKI